MMAPHFGLGLAALALAVQLGLTRSWQQEARALAAQERSLLGQQRETRRRLVDLETRAALRAHAAEIVGRSAAASSSDAALHKVRSGVVRALHTPFRLEVRPSEGPAVATVSLVTAGD